MRTSITELLQHRVVILDGGLGSSLIALGLESGRNPTLWNLEQPDRVREVHAAFIASGSDVIHSNTFGANRFVLKNHGLEDRMEEINLAAARVAREAAGEDRLVAGNMGPSGLLLEPLGEAEPAALEAGFSHQAAALEAGGVDYLSVETMMDLNEAVCALRGALSATRLAVTVSMTFDRKKRGFFTMMGNTPETCMKTLADEGAAAAGANCSIGSDDMVGLCPHLLEASGIPVIVKPNAGLPAIEDGRPVYEQDPEDFTRDIAAMVRLGARAVGGCCGTDARFIAAVKAEVDRISGEGDAR